MWEFKIADWDQKVPPAGDRTSEDKKVNKFYGAKEMMNLWNVWNGN